MGLPNQNRASQPDRPSESRVWRFDAFHAPGYGWATVGIAAASACFWLLRGYLDKGQASLLFLPAVIACAVRFGFGPAVWGAVLSFLCWDYFFLPPSYTLVVQDPKDWLSLFVFLVAAVTTAQLASRARIQSEQARAREAEILTLYHASEAISREVKPNRLLPTLSQQLQDLCNASDCIIFERSADGSSFRARSDLAGREDAGAESQLIEYMARAALDHGQIIGFGESRSLWSKAALAFSPATRPDQLSKMGVFAPLHAEDRIVGVLYVGARRDGQMFSPTEQRLILTLANHVAVVIAKQELAEAAAQADALRDADLLKDALLSMVTHELRTPLASIKGTASALLQPGVAYSEEDVRQSLEFVNIQADRLNTLVTNLLDLSRLQAGVWKPAKDWCDIIEILGTALDQISSDAASRVRVDAPDEMPLARLDYVQIALVLRNLLENAAKYSPPDAPIAVTIRVEAASGGDETLSLTVRDYGEGIAEAETELIFSRFYRGARHQNSAIHGSGLGLALCEAVIKAHGGIIAAGNAPAGEPPGAVFTVKLPIMEAVAAFPGET